MATLYKNVLPYFLNEEKICMSLEYPEEGIEYVYSLKPADWQILSNEWESRSEEWKEGITYYAGFAKMSESGSLITKALDEENIDIYMKGMYALYQSLFEEYAETKEISYQLSDIQKAKVISEIEKREHLPKKYNALMELKKLLNLK